MICRRGLLHIIVQNMKCTVRRIRMRVKMCDPSSTLITFLAMAQHTLHLMMKKGSSSFPETFRVKVLASLKKTPIITTPLPATHRRIAWQGNWTEQDFENARRLVPTLNHHPSPSLHPSSGPQAATDLCSSPLPLLARRPCRRCGFCAPSDHCLVLGQRHAPQRVHPCTRTAPRERASTHRWAERTPVAGAAHRRVARWFDQSFGVSCRLTSV
jgi:hypothetical protein